MLKETIGTIAKEMYPKIRTIRQHLHQYPELSFQEFETANFIKKTLESWNIKYQEIAQTGVVVVLEGNNPSLNTIALRADIDALPIQENNNIAYCSKNKGIMHACGHDVHTAILLGTAFILNQLKQDWEGTVKLIFQPGEEKNPGGASILIKEGVLENPTPQAILGLHVHNVLEVGTLSFRSGRVMASADEIYIDIKSKGGHAAAPHLTVDTVYTASLLIVSLQQLISRNNLALNPSILSICSIQGGNTTNVIPNEVKLKGTFRAMDETWRYEAHKKIRQICEGIALTSGAEIICHIDIGYPCVDNNDTLTNLAIACAQDLLGKENVFETEIRMGAEDFGYYSQKIPGCFYRLGVRNPTLETIPGVHTPVFNVDESSIETGMKAMSYLAINLLQKI